MSELKITTPLKDEDLEKIKSGDRLLISGIIYTARDAAHSRLVKTIEECKDLPFDIKGAVVYFAGPSPTRPGKVIGAIGPTTSYRMDTYSPLLIKMGLKGMIGKGPRSKEVKEAMVKYKAIYCAATGGAAALLSRCVKEANVIAYEDLGPEAIRRLLVEDFPVFVINDIFGNDLYESSRIKYAKPSAYF